MSMSFFDTLFPNGDGIHLGYVAVALNIPDDDDQSGEMNPKRNHFFAWPSEKESLVTFCLNHTREDVFASPALFSSPTSRSAANVSHQWAVHADGDDLPLSKLRVEPTLIVETSPGRHHLYWVTDTDDPIRLSEISRALAYTHAPDGCDKSGWNLGRLLRVPGSTSTKHRHTQGDYRVSLRNSGGPVSIDVIEGAYPPVSAPPRATSTDDPMPDPDETAKDPKTMREVSTLLAGSDIIRKLYVTELDKKVDPTVDRSAAMWHLLSEMVRSDVDRKVSMYVAWNSGCNKYLQEGRPKEELWDEVCKAYDDPENQSGRQDRVTEALFQELTMPDPLEENSRGSLEEDLSLEEVSELPSDKEICLLSLEERESVPQDTFVDHYERWASSRTDAPRTYHQAGAVTLLSAVFGELGTCPTPFEMGLNLWFLLLGPTTRTRKTTSMTLWTDLLEELNEVGYSYYLGSDITAEGLLRKWLPERNNRTSLITRDEVHGWFGEQSRKSYLAGLFETLTELFNGRVKKSRRVTDDPESDPEGIVRTNFILFLCGTLEQVTEELTVKNYQSGMLTRFLVAEAEAPPLSWDTIYFDQFMGDSHEEDDQRKDLVEFLREGKFFWRRELKGSRVKIIHFEPEAWIRYKEARFSILSSVENHPLGDIIEPTLTRTCDSIMKCSILLAMSEQCLQVKKKHVLKTLEFAEDWYRAVIKIASRVSDTPWSAMQDEILDVIRSKVGGITKQEIFRRFRKKYPERDIETSLSVLVKSRLTEVISEPGGRVRYLTPLNLRTPAERHPQSTT